MAIRLASADTRLTSAGSRWREELLLSPLGPVNMDRVLVECVKVMKENIYKFGSVVMLLNCE